MTWIALGSLAALLLALVGFVVQRGSLYGRLYSPAFVRQLRDGLARASVAALANKGRSVGMDELVASGAAFVLEGIAVVYTVSDTADGGCEHHLSLSHSGRWLPPPAATWLAGLILRLLGVRPGPVGFALAPSGVYHLVFPSTAEEPLGPVAALDDDQALRLIAVANEDRKQLAAILEQIEGPWPPAG